MFFLFASMCIACMSGAYRGQRPPNPPGTGVRDGLWAAMCVLGLPTGFYTRTSARRHWANCRTCSSLNVGKWSHMKNKISYSITALIIFGVFPPVTYSSVSIACLWDVGDQPRIHTFQGRSVRVRITKQKEQRCEKWETNRTALGGKFSEYRMPLRLFSTCLYASLQKGWGGNRPR